LLNLLLGWIIALDLGDDGAAAIAGVSTKYRCHRLCQLQMSLSSVAGGHGAAQRPTSDRLPELAIAPFLLRRVASCSAY
jgi:hypothetical protein